MKGYKVRVPQRADSLVIDDLQAPRMEGTTQVRVSMRAASINYRDILVLAGHAGPGSLEELIPLSDGAGVVTETGPGVWRVKPGDRVALTFNPDWLAGEWFASPGAGGRGGYLQGVACEEVVADQNELVVLPDYLSFEEGATLPCAGVTAWNALCAGPVQPGMTVLVQGGGGVSVFALQFARLFGARVIALSSSAERCERLAQLGADGTIDRTVHTEWGNQVRALTEGAGVDVAIDVGGASTIGQTVAAMKMGGRVALVGMLGGMADALPNILPSRVSIDPVTVGSRADLEALLRAMTLHQVRPVISKQYPFAELGTALSELARGEHFGKIVVSIP